MPSQQRDEYPLTPRSGYARSRELAEKRKVEIMKHMNHQRMSSIHKCFKENGGEVDIYEFIALMKDHLPEFRPSATTEDANDLSGNLSLVASLCDFFWEIDINGDGTLEWDEFALFIAETAAVHGRQDFVSDTTYYHPVQKLEGPAKRNALNNYINNVQYIPNLDSLLVTEQHSSVIKLYDAQDCSELGRMYHNSKILTATYAHTMAFNAAGGVQFRSENSDGVGAVFAAAANHTLAVWDLAPGSRQYSVRGAWPTPHAQSALCWTSRFNTLFSGSTAGIIHAWDVATRKEKSAIMGHDDIVTEAMTIPDIDCLATGSMDKTIRIWDVHTGARRQCLRGHRRGVLALAYSREQRLLVSAGHDHAAHVWSPFTPTLLYKLNGHVTSLISVKAIPDTLQVVTADAEGILKVWDLRTCKCMQTMSDAPIHNITSLTVCKGDKPKIVCSTRHLHFFDESNPFAEHVSHDIPVIAALFNTVSLTILTAAGRTVKIWNALTGRVCRIYCDIASSDITTICLDDRQRKFIVGDHAGQIKVYDYSNGALMKSMVSHEAEVTSLAYYDQDKTMVSTSWDRSVVVHDELDPDCGVKLREMDPLNAHKDDIISVTVSFSLSLIASVSQDKTVRLWDYESGKLDSCLTHSSAVVCMQFLHPYPLIAVGEASGMVTIWGIRLSKCKDQSVLTWNHRREGIEVPGSLHGKQYNTVEDLPNSMPVLMAWDTQTMRLYTGDDFGYLRAYGLNNVLGQLGEEAMSLPTASSGHRRSSMIPKVRSQSRHPGVPCELLNSVWSVSAHEESITCLNFVMDFKLIVSASVDCRVKVFSSTDGSHLGTLVQNISTRMSQGTLRSPHWNVPFDLESLRVRDTAFAKTAIEKEENEEASDDGSASNSERQNNQSSTDDDEDDDNDDVSKGDGDDDDRRATRSDVRRRVSAISANGSSVVPLPPVNGISSSSGQAAASGGMFPPVSNGGGQAVNGSFKNARGGSPIARELARVVKSQTRKNALHEMMQVPV